jgi:4-hydroxy-tetrahydrodipicolinate reductase
VKLALVGAGGRMGLSVLRLAHAAGDVRLVGAAVSAGSAYVGRDAGELAGVGNLGVALGGDVGSALLGAEVCVDFSSARAGVELCRAAAREGVALVSGTTGFGPAEMRALDEASKRVPVLWAPNMSLGVQVLADLVREAAARLGLGFDVELVEAHHRRKADAPSGTALRLVEALGEVRAGLRPVTGREGRPGERQPDELGIFAMRGGDVVGDHTVYFFGDGERLELTHRATSRDLFAHGALRAARFLRGRPAGRYTLRDVLAATPEPALH